MKLISKIEKNILKKIIPVVSIGTIAITATAVALGTSAVSDTVRTDYQSLLNVVSANTDAAIEREFESLKEIAANERLSDPTIAPFDKVKRVLLNEVERGGYISLNYVDVNGKAYTTDMKEVDFSSREYFKEAIKGNCFVADPLVSAATGRKIVVYAVPIMSQDKVVGVLTASKDAFELNDIIDDIQVGETGSAYIIDGDGRIIADKDISLVENDFNPVTSEDPQFNSLKAAFEKILAERSGDFEYNYNGTTRFVVFDELKNVDWQIALSVDKAEVFGAIQKLLVYLGGIATLIIAIVMWQTKRAASNISNPIIDTTDILEKVAGGDLSVCVPEELKEKNDEIGVMAQELEKMKEAIRGMLVAMGVESNNISREVANLLQSATTIAEFSENTSSASQEIAKGAQAQAEDLMQINNEFYDFEKQVKSIAEVVSDVNTEMRKMVELAKTGNNDMDSLSQSSESVTQSFKVLSENIMETNLKVSQISEATKLIDAISSQTNLLALNAAIEAARAGDQGRGFAVVAEEVRKLAEQSQKAVVTISELIKEIEIKSATVVETTNVASGEINDQSSKIENAIEAFGTIATSIQDILPHLDSAKGSLENTSERTTVLLSKVESTSAIAEEITGNIEEITASTVQGNESAQELKRVVTTLDKATEVLKDQTSAYKM